MKVGDLVRCVFQPGSSHIEDGAAVQMLHYIKGEFGIVIKVRPVGIHRVLFPQFGYEHDLSRNAIEVL